MASKLDILIAAKNNASPALKQVAGDVRGLDKAAGVLSAGMGGLALAGGVAGIAALGAAIVSTGMDMARTAAMATDVEASFRQLATAAGESATAMMSGLKAASRGAISDYDLMLTANRAMLLGVSQNTEDMSALMDVARARSQALGITTTQAFGDIVTGIGRMSPLILDNLGIVVDQEAANKAYAESIGTVASQLTEQEKKQALVNAVLRDSAALVAANAAAGDDAASTFERMDANIANTKIAIGDLFGPAFAMGANMVSGYLQNEIERLKEVTDNFESAYVGAMNFATGNNNVTSATLTYAKAAGEADGITRNLTFGLTGAGIAARTMGEGMTAAELKVANLATRLAGLKAQSDAASAALAGIESSAISRLESAASGAVGAMGAGTVASQYGPAAERLRAQIKAMDNLGLSTDYVNFKSQELAARAAEPFNLAAEAAREAAKETTGYADKLTDAEKQAQDAFNNIASMASSVLSGALQHGTGVDPDDVLASLGLPREDAINENARRLADIAKNGLKGQDWLGDFASEVPDLWNMIRLAQNPQEEAAHLLRDFQDGLLTSPIDKGKAKEIIKRQLLGDANMAELATEIAGEIAAEMGIPLQEALAASKGALGVGGATGMAGGEAAQTFSDGVGMGMEERNGGGLMVDTFIAQARAVYSKLKTAGADAGKVWGSEFLAYVGANVPPALISILTQLVTPGVISSIAQKGTLEGAAP